MRRFARAWPLLVVLLAGGCTMWKEKRPPTWQSATGAGTYETLLWQEIKAGNWRVVENSLAASFVALTPEGVLNRDQTVAYWQGLEVGDYTLGELRVTPNGDDMMVTYRLTLQHENPGEPAHFLMLTVWQQFEQGWIAVAHAQVPE